MGRYPPGLKYVTTSATQAIVSPVAAGKSPEVLMDLPAGVELDGCTGSFAAEGFHTVHIDGVCAYVPESSVQSIDQTTGDPQAH